MAALEDGLRSLTSDKLEKEFIPPLLKPLEHVFSFFQCVEIRRKSGGEYEIVGYR